MTYLTAVEDSRDKLSWTMIEPSFTYKLPLIKVTFDMFQVF